MSLVMVVGVDFLPSSLYESGISMGVGVGTTDSKNPLLFEDNSVLVQVAVVVIDLSVYDVA